MMLFYFRRIEPVPWEVQEIILLTQQDILKEVKEHYPWIQNKGALIIPN